MEVLDYKMNRDFVFESSVTDVSGAPDYHIHEGYEMLYLISGNLNFFIDDKIFAVAPGNIMMIPQEAIHKSYNSASKYERVVWNFTDHMIDKEILPLVRGLFKHQVYAPDVKFMQEIIKQFRAEWHNEHKHEPLSFYFSKQYLNLLLLYLIRHKDRFIVRGTNIANPSIDRLIKYINQNYKNPITLREFSQKLRLTPNYISKLFSENTGMGFKEYLTGVRIKNARDMLENTEEPISKIASECGFNDCNYFSTIFKNVIGLSPKRYRKMIKEKNL